MGEMIRFASIVEGMGKDFSLSIPLDNLVQYQPMIDITVVTLTGKHVFLTISKYDTIDRLKKRMYGIEKILIDNQMYAFKGKALDNANTLDYYGIKSGSRLHLILRLRGGMFHSTSSRADWISLNHSNKFQTGSCMVYHMRKHGIYLDLMDDLQHALDKCSTDDEINPLFDLIEKYYVE